MSTPDLEQQCHSPEVEERLKGEDNIAPSPLGATLSVGNIKHQATEDEISSVFSRLMRERERERERERKREGGGRGREGREREQEGEKAIHLLFSHCNAELRTCVTEGMPIMVLVYYIECNILTFTLIFSHLTSWCSCPGFVKLSLIHQNGGNCQTALVEFTVSTVWRMPSYSPSYEYY